MKWKWNSMRTIINYNSLIPCSVLKSLRAAEVWVSIEKKPCIFVYWRLSIKVLQMSHKFYQRGWCVLFWTVFAGDIFVTENVSGRWPLGGRLLPYSLQCQFKLLNCYYFLLTAYCLSPVGNLLTVKLMVWLPRCDMSYAVFLLTWQFFSQYPCTSGISSGLSGSPKTLFQFPHPYWKGERERT